MKNVFTTEEIVAMWAELEITVFEQGYKCNDGHYLTEDEFAALSDEEMIKIYFEIYPFRV